MRNIHRIIVFLLLHVSVGRIASIPVGTSTLFYKWYITSFVVSLMDFIQVLFLNFIYNMVARLKFISNTYRSIKINVNKFNRRSRIKRALKEERRFHSRMLVRAQALGQIGVVIIAAIPFIGGGMWSGLLLARLLKLNRFKSILLLMVGSIACSVILSLSYSGILGLIVSFSNR